MKVLKTKKLATFTPPDITNFFFIAYKQDIWSRRLNSNFNLKDFNYLEVLS